jgi:diphthamide biosynthesis methyltransferase
MRRGLEAVKRSERVYLEAYTSLLLVPKEQLVGPCSYTACAFCHEWGYHT